MPKSWIDEAIVLRTHNVGETDRFCILLTRDHGRIAARAIGVRRLLSRRGSGLLPLHHVSIVCEAHSFGTVIASATCLNPHCQSWQDAETFSQAEQGIELLLRFTEDGSPMPDVFALTLAFIAACRPPTVSSLPILFTFKLLTILGLCPSVTHSSVSHQAFRQGDSIVLSSRFGGLVTRHEDPAGLLLSSSLVCFLSVLDRHAFSEFPSCDDSLLSEFSRIVQGLLGSQLGSSLKAEGVSLSMSAAVTPT